MKRWIKFFSIVITLLVILCNYKMIKTLVNDKETNTVSADEVFTVDIVFDSTINEAVIGRVKAAVQSLPVETIKTFVQKGWKLVIVSSGDNEMDYKTKTLRILANENIETEIKEAFEDFMKGQIDET